MGPRRDRCVPARHAMRVDGVPVPAYDVANDISIVQEAGVARVDDIHIEREDHDIVWAGGALSEASVDDGRRVMSRNAANGGRGPRGSARPGWGRSAAHAPLPQGRDAQPAAALKRPRYVA